MNGPRDWSAALPATADSPHKALMAMRANASVSVICLLEMEGDFMLGRHSKYLRFVEGKRMQLHI